MKPLLTSYVIWQSTDPHVTLSFSTSSIEVVEAQPRVVTLKSPNNSSIPPVQLVLKLSIFSFYYWVQTLIITISSPWTSSKPSERIYRMFRPAIRKCLNYSWNFLSTLSFLLTDIILRSSISPFVARTGQYMKEQFTHVDDKVYLS